MGQNTGDYVVIIIVVGALAIGLASMAIGQLVRLWDWLINWRPVNHSEEAAPALMSRAEYRAPVDPLSSKDGRTDETPDGWAPSRDDLLTFYKILRAHGVGREEIRPALKTLRVPLSNDIWRDAAPPPPAAPAAPDYQTPIANRPTSAAFSDEATLA